MINELITIHDTTTIGAMGDGLTMQWYNPSTWECIDQTAKIMSEGIGRPCFISHVHGYGSVFTVTCSEHGWTMCDFGATFYDLMVASQEYYATPDYEVWYFGYNGMTTQKQAIELLQNALEEVELPEGVIQVYSGADVNREDIKFILFHHK